MRHRKSGRKLSRTSAHRKAMFANMAASLFRHEQIKTTLPKAKELRRVAEPLITLAKTATVANRRLAFARLRQRDIVVKLFDDLGPHYTARPGGYLRILKCGYRNGDAAPMAYVQLVDRDLGGDGDDDGDDDAVAAPAKVAKKAAKKKVAKKAAAESAVESDAGGDAPASDVASGDGGDAPTGDDAGAAKGGK